MISGTNEMAFYKQAFKHSRKEFTSTTVKSTKETQTQTHHTLHVGMGVGMGVAVVTEQTAAFCNCHSARCAPTPFAVYLEFTMCPSEASSRTKVVTPSWV